ISSWGSPIGSSSWILARRLPRALRPKFSEIRSCSKRIWAASSMLLQLRELSVSYGKVEALHGVSLAVPEGAIVTVIGPNGAGKTTLLSAIIGLLPSRGTIEYNGVSIEMLSVEERVSAGLVLVPEKRELFASMSVEDNLALGTFARRRARDSPATFED